MTNTIEGTNISFSPVKIEGRKKLDIKPGDTVRVHQKIQEKGKTRIQIFEGIVLATKHGKESGSMFTVRKVASGVGVEKIFPLYSPSIDKIEIIKRARVRRAKLYYIREKAAKQIRAKMRQMMLATVMSTKDNEEKEAEKTSEESSEVKAEDSTDGSSEEKTEEKKIPLEPTDQIDPASNTEGQADGTGGTGEKK